MTEKVFIRAEIQGVLPSGQYIVHLLANNADGFVFCTDDKSIVRPQVIEKLEHKFRMPPPGDAELEDFYESDYCQSCGAKMDANSKTSLPEATRQTVLDSFMKGSED